MRRLLPSLAALLLTASSAAADAEYTLDENSIEIAAIGPATTITPAEAPKSCGIAAGADPAAVVNLGLKLWKIIEANKPVVDVKTQYATALPEGIGDWSMMSGWSKPEGTVYRLTAKNAYGARVVDLRYQVVRTFGGSQDGAGRYLTAVGIEPLLLEVAWGYAFSLEASVPDSSVINVGTSSAPVAGLTTRIDWRITTPIKEARGRGLYYMQGDGYYRELGGTVPRERAEAMSRVARATEERLTSGR